MTTKAFEQIYEETHLKLYAFLYAKCPTGEDAADLLQETYLEYIKADRRHGAEYIKEPIAFLTQIAKKKLAKVYGDKRIIPLSLEEEYDDGGSLADSLVDENETEWTALTSAQAEQIWRFFGKKRTRYTQDLYLILSRRLQNQRDRRDHGAFGITG